MDGYFNDDKKEIAFNLAAPKFAKAKNDTTLSLSLKNKVDEYVEYAKRVGKTNQKLTNCVLIGCPQRSVVPFVSSIAEELNVQSRFVSAALIEKEGDLAALLTYINEGDIVIFSDIQLINQKLLDILIQAVSDYSINIITGKGQMAASYHLPLPSFTCFFLINSKQDLPDELEEECFYEIDFNAYKPDTRRSIIIDILQQSGLTAEENVLNALCKDEVSNNVLKSRVIRLRNRALSKGVKVIDYELLYEKSCDIHQLNEVDIMDGRDFEIFTGNLLRSNGFININVTPSSGDFGADVIAEKDDVRYAIQCKRYDSSVGVSAVQEVIASKSLHDCHVACVLTNNYFTPAAEELARKNLVILWDRNKLKYFIDKANM